MNEEQTAWFEALKTLVNGPAPDSAASYEEFVNKLQNQVDSSPEP